MPMSLETRLLDTLKDLRKNRDAAQDLVWELEGSVSVDRYKTLYHEDLEQYQVFCEAYIIKLLSRFVSGRDNIEILLAAFGLLQGYEDIGSVNERRVLYADKAVNTNKQISSDWADPSSSLQKIEDRIIKKLVERLLAAIGQTSGEPLGLAANVYIDLLERFPERLPAKYPMPQPSYLGGAFIVEGSPRKIPRTTEKATEACGYTVVTKVRIKGDPDRTWKDTVNIRAGDQVEYQIIYKNISDASHANVTVSDEIPANMQYVSGSTVLINSGNRTGVVVENDALVEGGLNIGSYHSGEDARVQFTAEAKDTGLTDGSEKLVNQSKVAVGDKVLHKHTEVTVKYGWGPERPTYKFDQPADHAVFNSVTDNPVLGDERFFVRIEEKSSGRAYSGNITLEAGKQYEVYIYYHNNAAWELNRAEHKYKGVARNVRLIANFPTKLTAGERKHVSAIIRADNTDPEAVWARAYIIAKEDMTLHYVTGSAKIYNDWKANGSVLSIKLFSSDGTFLGLDALNGVILGDQKLYSGYVVYTILTKAAQDS